ncbi:MAG: hypothetical protein HY365_03005 [Candidatus Aenigmarchaeota archaeon]|nr:hypothetical protein [Candidatus Aenigmarchaeota archaeon]
MFEANVICGRCGEAEKLGYDYCPCPRCGSVMIARAEKMLPAASAPRVPVAELPKKA